MFSGRSKCGFCEVCFNLGSHLFVIFSLFQSINRPLQQVADAFSDCKRIHFGDIDCSQDEGLLYPLFHFSFFFHCVLCLHF